MNRPFYAQGHIRNLTALLHAPAWRVGKVYPTRFMVFYYFKRLRFWASAGDGADWLLFIIGLEDLFAGVSS